MSNDLNRRKLLSAIGSAGVISLAGCVNTATENIFGEGNSVTKPSSDDVVKDLTIKIAPSSRSDPYFVVVSDDLTEDVPLFDGKQVRVSRQNDIPGEDMRDFLFTISTDPDYTSEEEKTVWVSEEGLKRLDGTEGTIVELKAFAASPVHSTRDGAKESNELVEQYIEASSDVLFMAHQAGKLKNNTELQALRGSSEYNYSSWALMGYGTTPEWAHRKWYNPPEIYNERSFYGLSQVGPPFETVVAFTGFDEESTGNKKHLVIGGLASDSVKEEIKTELEKTFLGSEDREESPVDPDVTMTIKYTGEYSGSDPTHIVNKLSDDQTEGVLLTQGSVIRSKYWKEVADAVMRAVD